MKEMIYGYDRKKEILYKGEYHGRKFAIVSMGIHPNAYVELKEKEVQKSKSYDDYDLDVHGGFTYLGNAHWDEEDKLTYIGWDYAHYGDFSGVYLQDKDYYWRNSGKEWTTQEIFEEVKSVIEQFEKAEWVDVSEPHFILKIKDNDEE